MARRTSDLSVAAVHKLTRSLTLRDGNEEAAVNHINRRNRAQMSPQPPAQKGPESPLAQGKEGNRRCRSKSAKQVPQSKRKLHSVWLP